MSRILSNPATSVAGFPGATATERRRPERRRPRRGRAFDALPLLALVVGGVIAGTASAASFSAAATVGSATINAGSTGLVISPGTVAITPLSPGESAYTAFTVTNTSATTANVRLDTLVQSGTSNAYSQRITIGLGVVASAGACSTAFAPLYLGTFAAPATPTPVGGSIAPGASTIVCMRTTLASDAPQGTQGTPLSFNLTFGVVP